jgi:hypothetical protein
MNINVAVQIAAVWAALLVVPGISHAELWLKDPTSGCAIWSDSLETDREVPIWSGSCVDGKASGLGVLVVHDKEGLLLVFNGEMLGGKANGAGVLRFRNDEHGGFDRYVGRFEDNKPMGDGIFESSEGWRFEAHFDGSFDSGSGTLRVYAETEGDNDAVVRGKFRDGELDGPALAYYETPEGEAYFGEIENGARDGFGTLVHANDDTYIGEFVKGKASGFGNYEAADGSMMIGRYEDGASNGPGTYIAENGDSYQGVFIDGKAEGLVLVTRADGSQAVETWKDGEKQQ